MDHRNAHLSTGRLMCPRPEKCQLIYHFVLLRTDTLSKLTFISCTRGCDGELDIGW